MAAPSSSPLDWHSWLRTLHLGVKPFLITLGSIALLWLAVLIAICVLRRECHCITWWPCIGQCRGTIWNLLLLVPAGIAAGSVAGFFAASYGVEQQRLSQMAKAVTTFAGGAAAGDLLRGPNSFLVSVFTNIAEVSGRCTTAGLVFVILLGFFPIGFLATYVLKAALLNPMLRVTSPGLFLNPADAQKAAEEGIGRDPSASAERAQRSSSSWQWKSLQAIDPSDPQKGRWGEKPRSNGYELSATVLPADTNGVYFKVILLVRSIEPERGLILDPVTFHLHPTFAQPVVTVNPKGGSATLTRLAWGAFTVGAELADGTKLELDLATLPDAPALFRER